MGSGWAPRAVGIPRQTGPHHVQTDGVKTPAKEALELGAAKLPIKTRIVRRQA
jgi:ribosomal protein L16/L10AE